MQLKEFQLLKYSSQFFPGDILQLGHAAKQCQTNFDFDLTCQIKL